MRRLPLYPEILFLPVFRIVGIKFHILSEYSVDPERIANST